MHRQNDSLYLFEVTSLFTEMLKDKIHVCLFGPAPKIGYLSIYAQMHPNTPMLMNPAGHEV